MTREYETKFIPKAIAENLYNVDPEYFAQYQRNYMLKKKNLEIQVLRENKKMEVIQQILQEDSFIDIKRQQMRIRALKTIRDGKRFSEMQKRLEEIAIQSQNAKQKKEGKSKKNDEEKQHQAVVFQITNK